MLKRFQVGFEVLEKRLRFPPGVRIAAAKEHATDGALILTIVDVDGRMPDSMDYSDDVGGTIPDTPQEIDPVCSMGGWSGTLIHGEGPNSIVAGRTGADQDP